MKEMKLYRPHKRLAVWMSFGYCVCASILSCGLIFLDQSIKMLCLCIFCILFFCIFFYMQCNEYSQVIAFSDSEIQVLGSNFYDKYSWTDFSHAYYYINPRGHLFIVLSSEELIMKQIKSIANRICRRRKNINSERKLSIYVGSLFIDSELNDKNKDVMVIEEIKKHNIIIHT